MLDDPIVEEIRRYRQEHARKHRNDIDSIARELKELEKKSKRPVVSFDPKRIPSRSS